MKIGIWKYPIYNNLYYISIGAGVFEHLIYILLLAWAFAKGPSKRIMEANPEAHRLFGYFDEPLLGQSLYDLFWDEKLSSQTELHQYHFRTGKRWVHVEMLMKNRKGQKLVTLVEGDKLESMLKEFQTLIFLKGRNASFPPVTESVFSPTTGRISTS